MATGVQPSEVHLRTPLQPSDVPTTSCNVWDITDTSYYKWQLVSNHPTCICILPTPRRSTPLPSNKSYPPCLPESRAHLWLPHNKKNGLADSPTILPAVAKETTPEGKYNQLCKGIYEYFANTHGVFLKQSESRVRGYHQRDLKRLWKKKIQCHRQVRLAASLGSESLSELSSQWHRAIGEHNKALRSVKRQRQEIQLNRKKSDPTFSVEDAFQYFRHTWLHRRLWMSILAPLSHNSK